MEGCAQVDKLEALTLQPPSLIDASSLTVKGPCKFVPGIKIVGDVTFVNGANLKLDFKRCLRLLWICIWLG